MAAPLTSTNSDIVCSLQVQASRSLHYVLVRYVSPVVGYSHILELTYEKMNFGDAWKDFMGVCDKDNTFAILDFFHEQGGNFIDTANNCSTLWKP